MTLMISYFATGLPYLDGDIGSPFTFIILCIIACIVIRKDMKKKKRSSQASFTKEELAANQRARQNHLLECQENRRKSESYRKRDLYQMDSLLKIYGKEDICVRSKVEWDFGSWEAFYKFLDSFDQNLPTVKQVRKLLSK